MEEINITPILKDKGFSDNLLTYGAIINTEDNKTYAFIPMVYEIINDEKGSFKEHINDDLLPEDVVEFYKQCSVVKHKEDENTDK